MCVKFDRLEFGSRAPCLFCDPNKLPDLPETHLSHLRWAQGLAGDMGKTSGAFLVG